MSLSREEIVRMAKAFAWMREGQKETEDFIVDFFNAAYAAGAAAEREQCAVVCDEHSRGKRALEHYAALTASKASRDCAAAIRARGDK